MSDKPMNSGQNQLQIIDEQAMTELGAQLALLAVKGTIIYLDGDLGAGKTTLVRGFLRALGYQEAVKSPTFTIVEPYSLDNNKLSDYNKLEQTFKQALKQQEQQEQKVKQKVKQDVQSGSNQSDNKKNIPEKIYHFDLYRLEDPEELEYMGIRDYLDGQAVALIEWPDKGYGVLPAADVLIKITHQKQGRGVELLSYSQNGADIVSKLISAMTGRVVV